MFRKIGLCTGILSSIASVNAFALSVECKTEYYLSDCANTPHFPDKCIRTGAKKVFEIGEIGDFSNATRLEFQDKWTRTVVSLWRGCNGAGNVERVCTSFRTIVEQNLSNRIGISSSQALNELDINGVTPDTLLAKVFLNPVRAVDLDGLNVESLASDCKFK